MQRAAHSPVPLNITRRDFVNGALAGSGAMLSTKTSLAETTAQTSKKNAWDGYGGVGDYARSHGNTPEVVGAAHKIRDRAYGPLDQETTIELPGVLDLVVVGGGMSGLGAAFEFKKRASPGQRCLILDNHSMVGGESKRNEFVVNGQPVFGPQGANDFGVPDPGVESYELFTELGLPRAYEYANWNETYKPLKFAYDHYGPMYWLAEHVDTGYYLHDENRWTDDFLEGVREHSSLKQDFARLKNLAEKPYEGPSFERWLDSMTYQHYLEEILRLSPEITRFINPVLASSIGLGADVISAYGAFQLGLPGVNAFSEPWRPDVKALQSFPGGNDGIARHALKYVIPKAIAGDSSFASIMNASIDFSALDQPDSRIGVRLDATVISVRHVTDPEESELVEIIYAKHGRLYRLKARGVVMASGGWVNRHIVKDLPEQHRRAYEAFHHAPMMVVNVALINWRFLYELGYTAFRWFDGFGFFCNLRNSMQIGDHRPRLDPNQPTVLTLYVPFMFPGLPLREQTTRGRTELLSTSFFDYEKKILDQFTTMFGATGFDPVKDVAGIVLNRWGHAYVCPQPGFYFGQNAEKGPSDVIRQPHGRVTFGHSELRGHQYWSGAMSEGRRATAQVFEM